MAKIEDAVPEEKELVINMDGRSRTIIYIYCDDPYWIKRLDRMLEATYIAPSGAKNYMADIDLLIKLLSKGKKNEKESQ